MANETLLSLATPGVPPYSARGLSQTLEPIDQATSARRTVNGTLIDLSVPELRKYRSTITCTDMDSPALDGYWPGSITVVDCVAELSYQTSTGGPERTVVPGSSREEGAFTFYRPRLTMMILRWSISKDEWGAACGWVLELEEV